MACSMHSRTFEKGGTGSYTSRLGSSNTSSYPGFPRFLLPQVDGRFVSVLYDPRPQSGSKAPIIYCLDSICYHMGGPLTTGDIEDVCSLLGSCLFAFQIDGIPSLSCPWHQYKINLRDGSRLSRPVTFDPKTRRPIPGKWEVRTEARLPL